MTFLYKQTFNRKQNVILKNVNKNAKKKKPKQNTDAQEAFYYLRTNDY